MKQKHILLTMLALLVASCTNDELVEKTALNRNDITVTAVLSPKARVVFEADGNVTHAYWSEGDDITIYDESQGALDYQLTTMDEDGGTATFAPLGNSVQYTEGTVYAIYPATPVTDGVAVIPNTDVWEEGKPMPFAYAYGKMEESTLVLEFHHLFAYLKLTLNAETVADSETKDITAIQIANTSATYPIAVVGGKYNFIQHNSSSQGGINSMLFNLKQPFTATGDAEKVVYIPVLTQPAGENITINVLSGSDVLSTFTKETPASGFVVGNAYAFSPKVSYTREGNTITLSTAGTLSQAISEEEKYTLTSLKIVGPLNGDDIRFLREMAGVDVEGMLTEGKLVDLDISEASIVEGGGAYYTDCYTTDDVIGNDMFRETVLEKIVLPNNVTKIDNRAFNFCQAIEEIVIPESVVTIGEDAFSHSGALESIVIPEGVTTISNNAFYQCLALTNLNLPEGLVSIGNCAFWGCALENINFPETLTSIGFGAFQFNDTFTEITLPNAVTSVGVGAFSYCRSLINVTLGTGLTEICSEMFWNCSLLTTVNIQGDVVSIGQSAFDGCEALVNINIPETVTTLGSSAFSGCTSLAEVVCNAITPPALNSAVFKNIASPATLFVPAGCSTAYSEGDWAQYFTTIKEM